MREPIDSPFDSHPISSFDVMRLAAKQVTRMGRLLGREIALLLFGNCEERIGCGFSCAGHCTIIQSICIFVQVPTDFPRAVSVVVFVLPARTDTRWWHDYVIRCKLRFIRGRLRFGDGKNSAPFPSAIVIFRALDVLSHGRHVGSLFD